MRVNITRTKVNSPVGQLDVAQIDVDGDGVPDLSFAVFPGTSDADVQARGEQLVRDYNQTGVRLEQIEEA